MGIIVEGVSGLTGGKEVPMDILAVSLSFLSGPHCGACYSGGTSVVFTVAHIDFSDSLHLFPHQVTPIYMVILSEAMIQG